MFFLFFLIPITILEEKYNYLCFFMNTYKWKESFMVLTSEKVTCVGTRRENVSCFSRSSFKTEGFLTLATVNRTKLGLMEHSLLQFWKTEVLGIKPEKSERDLKWLLPLLLLLFTYSLLVTALNENQHSDSVRLFNIFHSKVCILNYMESRTIFPLLLKSI